MDYEKAWFLLATAVVISYISRVFVDWIVLILGIIALAVVVFAALEVF